MTVRELVDEYNQFVEADEDKLRVGDTPAATTPALPAGRQVDVQVSRWLALQRQRLDALEKRLIDAAIRYFARAGK
jgi:hypothetical protein